MMMRLTLMIAMSIVSVICFAEMRQKDEGDVIYSPIGKRDPFKVPAFKEGARFVNSFSPLEKYAVDQFVLQGVLRSDKIPKAMFRDPEGKTHIISEGTRIGRSGAVVSRILNREVIITERTTNYLGSETLFERVFSLPNDNLAAAEPASKQPAPTNNPKTIEKPTQSGGEE